MRISKITKRGLRRWSHSVDIKVIKRATEAFEVLARLRDVELKCETYGQTEFMVWLAQGEGQWFMLTCAEGEELMGYAVCIPPCLLNSRVHVLEAKGRGDGGVVKELLKKVGEGCEGLGASGISMCSRRCPKAWAHYGFRETSRTYVMDVERSQDGGRNGYDSPTATDTGS